MLNLRVIRWRHTTTIRKNKVYFLQFQLVHIYVENVCKLADFRNLREENSSGSCSKEE